LTTGAPLGALGIEFETRRRNRVNGVVAQRDERGFALRVEQSFGNCPKYIQRRRPVARSQSGAAPMARKLDAALTDGALKLIARADTFFIASGSPHAGGSDPAEGLDVSHRGGKPGFVRVRRRGGRAELAWPDFSGNRMFNTIGNLALEPRAGVLFIDYASGEALSLAGRAEVAWSGWEIPAFDGAERLLSFEVEAALWLPAALPLVWSEAKLAEELAETGEWWDTDSRTSR
jgi:predicted pyridoxine 5'-phosphate oxidase superfamily flavin-nucleotide-binding protein